MLHRDGFGAEEAEGMLLLLWLLLKMILGILPSPVVVV